MTGLKLLIVATALAAALSSFVAASLHAQDLLPKAAPQSRPVVIQNAILHTMFFGFREVQRRTKENVADYLGRAYTDIFQRPVEDVLSNAGLQDLTAWVDFSALSHAKQANVLPFIADWCRARLAPHKVPRYVWFMDQALPRNANGKFLRRELRDELARQIVEA